MQVHVPRDDPALRIFGVRVNLILDNQRQPLPDESNRQVLLLPPGGTSNFEAVSRQSRASDFVLRLSWNK